MNTPTPRPATVPGPDHPVTVGVDAQSLDLLRELQKEFGDVVAVNRPNGRKGLFINQPDLIHRILVKHHGKFHKGPEFERVKMLLGNGIIVSDGDTWRRSRRMIQPAFSRKQLHRLIDMMHACCISCAERWDKLATNPDPEHRQVDVTREMNDAGLELILRAIFGVDYDNSIMGSGTNPFAFLSEDTTRDLRVVMQVRELRSLILNIVEQRRSQPAASDYDFLSMLMSQKDKDGEGYTDKELLDEIITLTVAGYETSAGTLNWAWYLIATHPEVERKLLDEYATVFQRTDEINAELLSSLTYTQQVLDETLRLYPPVWLFSRRAVTSFDLGDLHIEEGTDLYISPLLLQTTERYWPDPNTFDPERYAPDKIIEDGLSLPFSLGPRRCLGEYFSFLEMKLILATLLPRFILRPQSDAPPQLELGINLRSQGAICLNIESRAS